MVVLKKKVLEELYGEFYGEFYGVKLTYEGRSSDSVLVGTFQSLKVAKIIGVDPSHFIEDFVVVEEWLH